MAQTLGELTQGLGLGVGLPDIHLQIAHSIDEKTLETLQMAVTSAVTTGMDPLTPARIEEYTVSLFEEPWERASSTSLWRMTC
jgi:hypothetical protein